MGVDFYACKCCGESRYEEYIDYCEGCGKRIGTCCVVNDDIGDNFTYPYRVKYDGSAEQKEEYDIEDDWEEKGWVTTGEPLDDVGIDPKYCPFCSGEEVAKEDVLTYLLKKCGISYEEAEKEYRQNRR